jgi:ribonuclease HI
MSKDKEADKVSKKKETNQPALKKKRDPKRKDHDDDDDENVTVPRKKKKKNATPTEALPTGSIMCFTDGSCQKNPGPCGSAAAIFIKEEKSHKVHPKMEKKSFHGHGTNQIAELGGFKLGFELIADYLAQKKNPQTAEIYMFSDSRYAIGLLTQNWQAKANVDLVQEVRLLLETLKSNYPNCNLIIEWVPGHSGIPENEYVDRLSKSTVKK